MQLGSHGFAAPSVVLVDSSGGFVVGDAADRGGAQQPDRVARYFKRRVGDDKPLLLAGASYPPELLLARVHRWVVDSVTAERPAPPSSVVITHPAAWGPYRLEVLGSALEQAGVRGATLLPEPAAAAWYYASTRSLAPGGSILVYDFGGGTFDAAVVRDTGAGFELVGRPTGIDSIGGINVDESVQAFVLEALGPAVEELDPDSPGDLADLQELRRRCTAAKEALSEDTSAVIAARLRTASVDLRLTRDDLRRMVDRLIDETVASTEHALDDAGVTAGDLSAILLVGGSSRLPLVVERLESAFGVPVAADVHPKLAVAQGAARWGEVQRLGPPVVAEPAPPVVVASPPAAPVAPVPSPSPAPAPPAAAPSWAAAPAAPAAPAPVAPTPASAPEAPPPAVEAPVAPPAPVAVPSAPAAVAPTAPAEPASTRSGTTVFATGLVALVLVVTAVVVALAGLGAPSRPGTAEDGVAVVDGNGDEIGGDAVDLSEPVRIRVDSEAVPGGASVTADLAFGPVPLPGPDPAELAPIAGGGVAELDLSGAKSLVTGALDLDVHVLDAGGAELTTTELGIDGSTPPWTSVAGVVALALVLLVVAVLENLLRPAWRRGRATVTQTVQVGIYGGALGVLAVVLVGLFGATAPSVAGAIATAVVAALAGIVTTRVLVGRRG